MSVFCRTDDFCGLREDSNYTYRPSPSRALSNGTKNWLDIVVKDDRKRVKVFFQMQYEGEIGQIRHFVVGLIKNKIVTLEEGAKILKIDDDVYWMIRLEEDLAAVTLH